MTGSLCWPMIILVAATEVLGGGAQPTFFDELAAVGFEDVEVAVFVSEIQPGRHLYVLGATLIHEWILLPGLREPEAVCRPSEGTARGLALLISSCLVHGASGEGDRLLGGVLGRGHHRKAAHPRSVETLPLGGTTIPPTMTPIDGSSK